MPKRVFVSCPIVLHLSPDQLSIKQAVITRLLSDGLDVQEFGVSGIPKALGWSFEDAITVISKCHGVVLFGFAQWKHVATWGSLTFPTEYVHIEGTIALQRGIPTLIIADEGVANRGIVSTYVKQYINYIPQHSKAAWVTSGEFQSQYGDWLQRVRAQRDIFLGYCSKASTVAHEIRDFIEGQGFTTLDWQRDFAPGRTVLDEIEEASRRCLAGVFLFTKDDPIRGSRINAAPRDNVVFESGYFCHAKGRERTLIVLEKGSRLPADLGGGIYVSMEDRTNLGPVYAQLSRFLRRHF